MLSQQLTRCLTWLHDVKGVLGEAASATGYSCSPLRVPCHRPEATVDDLKALITRGSDLFTQPWPFSGVRAEGPRACWRRVTSMPCCPLFPLHAQAPKGQLWNLPEVSSALAALTVSACPLATCA